MLTPFLVFAEEACQLRLWTADKLDEKCQEVLRHLTIDAYYDNGRGIIGDPISNWNNLRLEARQEIKRTSQWRRYENFLLKYAIACSSGPQNTDKTRKSVETKPTGRPRKDSERELVRALKTQDKSWKDIAATLNAQTGQNKDPEAYRALLRSSSPNRKPPVKNGQK